MPFITIAIPVLHSSGAWIAYAGSGYLAGTLSSTWIGAFVLGNAGFLSSVGLISAAGIASATGVLAGMGASASAALGVGLTNIGLGGVASWLGIAPAMTFLGVTPLGWAIGGGAIALTSVAMLVTRKVLGQINEERKNGGLEPIGMRQIVDDVRAFEADSMRQIVINLASESGAVSFDTEKDVVSINRQAYSLKRLKYRVKKDGTEAIVFATKLGREVMVFLVCGPKKLVD